MVSTVSPDWIVPTDNQTNIATRPMIAAMTGITMNQFQNPLENSAMLVPLFWITDHGAVVILERNARRLVKRPLAFSTPRPKHDTDKQHQYYNGPNAMKA